MATNLEKAFGNAHLYQLEEEEYNKMNAVQYAALSGFIVSDRLARLSDKYYMCEERHWTNRPEIQQEMVRLCEKHGHCGLDNGCAESGSFDFHCIFCGWGFSGYH